MITPSVSWIVCPASLYHCQLLMLTMWHNTVFWLGKTTLGQQAYSNHQTISLSSCEERGWNNLRQTWVGGGRSVPFQRLLSPQSSVAWSLQTSVASWSGVQREEDCSCHLTRYRCFGRSSISSASQTSCCEWICCCDSTRWSSIARGPTLRLARDTPHLAPNSL